METGTDTLSFKASSGTVQSTFNFSDLSTTFAGDVGIKKAGANTLLYLPAKPLKLRFSFNIPQILGCGSIANTEPNMPTFFAKKIV